MAKEFDADIGLRRLVAIGDAMVLRAGELRANVDALQSQIDGVAAKSDAPIRKMRPQLYEKRKALLDRQSGSA